MAHDFLGNELSIGDDVVFLNYNGTSANLERGKITNVSEKTAEISGKRRAEYKIVRVNPVKPTMGNTWIPCSERLPERNVSVLGWCKDNPFARYCPEIVSWNGNGWVFVYARRYVTNVTHWQPLPEPPKEGGAENG